MDEHPPPTFDTTRAHSARVWNYFLGGKDNFPVDREQGDRIIATFPEIIDVARASRAFLVRAVRHLTAEVGIRQFLDVGTGLPTLNNTHQVAQRVAPQSRVVYVDNDPMVLLHARALLVGTPEGATAYVEADARDPEAILAAATRTLDFDQPIALMMLSVMGLIDDDEQAYAIVRRMLADLPPGSHLVLEDGSHPGDAPPVPVQKINEVAEGNGYRYRSVEQIARFFDGLELLEPGLVSPDRWRRDPAEGGPLAPYETCGVARKP